MEKKRKIYAEVVEDTAMEQFEACMASPFVVQGALMPDTHTGYDAPIGSVFATEGVLYPAWVGYDIGCGMSAIQVDANKDDLTAKAHGIYNNIYRDVPVGFNTHKQEQSWEGINIPHTEIATEIYARRAAKQWVLWVVVTTLLKLAMM